MTDTTARTATPDPGSPLSKLNTIRLPLWVSLVLVVLLIGVFAWKQVAVGAAERRLAEERQALIARSESERAALEGTAQEALARHSDEVHRLFGTALAWNIRSAMMRKNFDEIDQYFSALVQDHGIQLVLLADPAGKVLLASDRRFHGTQVSERFPAALLQEPGVTIQPGEADQRTMALAIQGLNARLGTVILTYVAP